MVADVGHCAHAAARYNSTKFVGILLLLDVNPPCTSIAPMVCWPAVASGLLTTPPPGGHSHSKQRACLLVAFTWLASHWLQVRRAAEAIRYFIEDIQHIQLTGKCQISWQSNGHNAQTVPFISRGLADGDISVTWQRTSSLATSPSHSINTRHPQLLPHTTRLTDA